MNTLPGATEIVDNTFEEKIFAFPGSAETPKQVVHLKVSTAKPIHSSLAASSQTSDSGTNDDDRFCQPLPAK